MKVKDWLFTVKDQGYINVPHVLKLFRKKRLQSNFYETWNGWR